MEHGAVVGKQARNQLLLSTRKPRQQRAKRLCHACKLLPLLASMVPLFLARPVQPISSNPAEAAVLVTANSSQPVLLQSMMNTSITHLVYQLPFFQLVPAAWTYISEQTPFMLMRNFTVTSDVHPQTVIDFQYIARRVVLGDSTTPVTFKFENLTLTNVRKFDTIGIDWFTKSPAATVLLENVVVVDTVCSASPADALAAANAAPRLPGHPHNSVSMLPVVCVYLRDGQRCFENSLHFGSFAAQDSQGGSYTFVQRNTARVCLSYVDPQCLQQHDLDYCWQQKAREVQPLQQQQQGSPAQLSAGVAAGIAVAVVVVLFATGTLCWWWFCGRRRAANNQSHQQGFKDLSFHNARHGSQAGTLDSTPSVIRSVYSSGTPETAISHLRSVSGNVQLGMLLGAGSFGRVYRGKWHNHDVAIKVINCNAKELPKVLQEAEVMMKLDHEHIVRALHCMVVDKTPQQESGAETSAGEGQHSTGRARSSIGNGSANAVGQGSFTHSHHSSRHHRHQQQQQPQPLPSNSSTSATTSATVVSRTASAGEKILSGLKALIGSSKGSKSTCQTDSSRQHGALVSSSKYLSTRGTTGHVNTVQGAYNKAGEALQEQASAEMTVQERNSVAILPSDVADLSTGIETAAEQPKACQDVEVWLVMELCSAGTLKQSCSTPKDTLAMAKLVARLLEVARGMAYLHSHNCIHGDLKAGNVMLKSTIYGSFGQVAKISDFGLAFTLMDGATHRSTQTTGTISHSAPEVLTTGRLSPAADVYSFGIMMWELFTARSAFQHVHYGNVVQRVVAGERPPMPAEAPEEYKLLMEHCWAAEPKVRPSFEQVALCLELLLEDLQSITTELVDGSAGALQTEGQEPDTPAAGDQQVAAPAAYITQHARTAFGSQHSTALQQQQQRVLQHQGSANSAAGPGCGSQTARGLLVKSRHVQDL